MKKKNYFLNLKKFWFVNFNASKNIAKQLSLNEMFKKTKCLYFKHFVFLNFFLKNNENYKHIHVYIYFFNLLKNNYYKINNIQKLSKDFFRIFYFTLFLRKSYYFSSYKYNLIFFYKNWKVLKYYFLPKKLQFNKFFLWKFVCLIDFKNLIDNLFLTINKNYYFINLLYSQLFNNVIDYQSLFFGNFISTNITKCFIYPTLLDFNLSSFLKKNFLFWKFFFKFSKNLSFDYLSFWSFLNVSLFFTWSFLFQYNIPNSGFNFLYLKSLNSMYFWTGDIKWSFFFEWNLIWDWWNFIYWIGIPYRSLFLGSYKEWLFFSKNYNKVDVDKPNYHFFSLRKKNFKNYFNNYIFSNTYYLKKTKKKK